MGRGLIGAIAGGALGAVIWGVLAYLTDREFGLIAWAIGGLVGAGAVLLGGRGKTLALACGVIAAASILGGKFVMAVFVLDSGVQAVAEEELAKEYDINLHEAMERDAADFAALRGPEDHAEFMLTHDYAADSPVSAVELAAFRAHSVPLLQRWGAGMPPIEEARQQFVAHRAPLVAEEMRQQIGHADVLKESFGFMDLLFFGFGVFTAYSLVARRTDEEGALGGASSPPATGPYPGQPQGAPPAPQPPQQPKA